MAAALPLSRSAPAPVGRADLWRRFPLVFAAFVAAVSLLPYLLAYLWTPPGHHFAGFFFIADDAATYLSKMRQGAAGSWLWADPYTSEAHGGVFLFSFYLLFGHLAALLHLPLIATYHLARISGTVALVFAVDRLCRRLIPGQRNLGLVLVLLGSGLGFLAQAAGNPAILGSKLEALDLHLPELSGWYSMLAIPHFTWATALIVIALLGLLEIIDHPGWRAIVATAAALTALTAIHPQMIPVIAVIWLAYRAVLFTWDTRPTWRQLAMEATPFLITTPLLAYNAWILFADPTIAEWARQWRHQAPGPLSLGLSLGLPAVFAIVGMITAWRRRDRGLALMFVWPPVVFLLLYLPNLANIQRRLLDALYVPLGILAAVGLRALTARLRRARARRVEALLVSACCFSSLIVLAIALRFASGAFAEAYVSSDAWSAMQWLAVHHQPDDRALSAPGSGELLPAWAGVRVYVGHYSETLNYFEKIRNVGTVLTPGISPAVVQAFLRTNGITLVYWGPDEERTGFEPDGQLYLEAVHREGTVAIYRVIPQAAEP